MPLSKAIRSRVPDSMRDSPGLRALTLAVGLTPPRPMHTRAEASMLARLAGGAERVVEIGVYEGSSAFVLCDALTSDAELHLIDPFTDESGWAMRPGWHATPAATRLAVRRRARKRGPSLHWHIARSQDVGRFWTGPKVDVVFIDGDHSPEGCGEDWEIWHPHVRPGGAVALHDARLGQPNGTGSPGPTSVVDERLRGGRAPAGWELAGEVDSLVVVRRSG